MADTVARMLEQLVPGKRPPLESWHPPLSGDIDIVIASDGRWYHQGGLIERFELVKLFASILRYEAEIGFVLVTPVEKWRIQVEDAPFIAVALSRRQRQRQQLLVFATNVGEEVCVDSGHPLVLLGDANQKKPYITVRNGLMAKLSRPVYYQLVEWAEEFEGRQGVWSSGEFYPLE
jgi:hypothetical protein